jgi:ribosomal protein L36
MKVIHDRLGNLKPSKKTNISKALSDLAKNIKRRGLIMVISDLFDDPKQVLDSLKHFRYRKHEVVVFQILDKAELEFPFGDFILFEDMESDLKVMADSKAIRNEYISRIRAFIHELQDNCRKNRIDFALFDTSVPLDVALATYLLHRNKQ